MDDQRRVYCSGKEAGEMLAAFTAWIALRSASMSWIGEEGAGGGASDVAIGEAIVEGAGGGLWGGVKTSRAWYEELRYG